MKITISVTRIILASSAFLLAGANFAFLRNLTATFGDTPQGLAHLLSLGTALYCVLVLFLTLVTPGRALKPVLTLLFFVAAVSAYFMDSYNVIIDSDMLGNALATDTAEAVDLLSVNLVAYLLVLGVLPTALLAGVKVQRQPLREGLLARARLFAGAAGVMLAVVLFSGAFYATFVREHKSLRYYANPFTPLYGVYSYLKDQVDDSPRTLQAVGEDAHIPPIDADRELMILVVGETARADHFSLNGYERQTNPGLERRDVISFASVAACGTSTEISVPCMFSMFDHDNFRKDRARSTENVLDVLDHAGVNILWRDNNSSSKGVANRMVFEDFRSSETNPVCDRECRDEGLLANLDAFLDANPRGDILIVLHQMGSHGPAYYKRYPEEFRKFEPTCDTNQLDTCTKEEIVNTYDNSILYTDHFLSLAIDWLAEHDGAFETAMLYVSDHGESLGESGIFLHGLPYFAAPEAQTAVPVLFWFGGHYNDAEPANVRAIAGRPFTHSSVFHTLLGFFEVETKVYRQELDWLALSRQLGEQSKSPVGSGH